MILNTTRASREGQQLTALKSEFGIPMIFPMKSRGILLQCKAPRKLSVGLMVVSTPGLITP